MDEFRIPIMGFRTDFLSHVKIRASGKFSADLRISLIYKLIMEATVRASWRESGADLNMRLA